MKIDYTYFRCRNVDTIEEEIMSAETIYAHEIANKLFDTLMYELSELSPIERDYIARKHREYKDGNDKP